MKTRWMQMIIFFLLMGLMTVPAFAFDSGSTGALGAFNPTANIAVDLPDDGILNYTTINIPSGVTVTFKKNTTNTPVYMLATGNVTVAGTINIGGANANGIANGRGGPGGFDGGLGAGSGTCGGVGLGPGGGKMGGNTNFAYGAGGGGGGFVAAGSSGTVLSSGYGTGGAGGQAYGNPSVQPLIGGSGGGGGCGSNQNSSYYGGAGGGGGGAILIASNGTIDVSGSILANGGVGGAASEYSGNGGGGSGGAIKLMADIVKGSGTLSATGGSGTPSGGYYTGGNGGNGRIRIEANSLQRPLNAVSTPAFIYLDAPVYVFPPNMPVLKITSIGGTTVPAAPTGKYSSPDIVLPTNIANPVAVAVEANNIPAGTTVTLSVVSQLGASSSKTAILTGTTAVSTATANLTLSAKYVNIISVSATFTVTASNEMPVFADGEKVIKMRVASVLGGSSSVTYITESGKEILAQM